MKKKKKNKITDNVHKDLYETYKELYTTALNELHFANLQIEHLYSVLDELITFAGTLESSVIKNALERHQLDKLIHAKLLFKDSEEKL